MKLSKVQEQISKNILPGNTYTAKQLNCQIRSLKALQSTNFLKNHGGWGTHETFGKEREKIEWSLTDNTDDIMNLSDLLSLVCVEADEDTIKSWSLYQMITAQEWAIRLHLAASDNILKVPKRPEFL